MLCEGNQSLSHKIFSDALTFLASMYKRFKMVESSAGSMFSSAAGISLSFLHAKVGRERLVYFVVSNHSVLNLYFKR